MIDIHSHVLPGLDDGAPNLGAAAAMLAIAAGAGTTHIVATPHSNPSTPYSHAATAAAATRLREFLPLELTLHTGCELHFTFDNIHAALSNPHDYSINGRGYLLLEFHELLIPPNITEILDQLLRAGLVPIIAHPERNARLAADIPLLQTWVHRGVFLQLTAMSVTGQFGPPASQTSADLLRKGLVHFVASDAHDDEYRQPRLDLARDHLSTHFSPLYAQLLTHDHPEAVILGRAIDPGPLAPPPKPRRWWHF